MLEIYIKLLPVFAWFLLGLCLKTFNILTQKHGAILLKFMFFFTLPALVLAKITETELAADKLYLPFMNVGVNLICLGVMALVTRKMEIRRDVLGVMLVACMITNNFFVFPFILAVLGNEALVDAMIFDIGNAITTLTIAYALAFAYGPLELEFKNILLNIVKLPVSWALLVALGMNFGGYHLSPQLIAILDPIGLLTNPIILVALGIYFNFRLENRRLLLLTAFIRMGLGLLIGIGFTVLFGLEGVTAISVILCCSAPVGFNALTFPVLAKLDMAFASSITSMTILIGLFSVPILMYFLQSFITL
ncbi:MAG: hypothetical protein GKR93_06780 [Gammaproteobacteria bacterium]|nr:hypothetical protein [Gammaproteobacteria bacterium]